MRIAVVDDHPIFGDGVANALAADPTFEIVGRGSTAEHAIRIAQEQLPDILLLDINLPGNGIDATRKIAELCPIVRVIILTASESEEHLTQALEAGARGYLVKGIGATQLIETLKAIQQGETYVSPGLAARLLTRMARRSQSAEDGVVLTNREEDILALVAIGKTNKEIARAFDIAEKTVKHFMTNIMQKLQVRNRVEAAIAARQRVRQFEKNPPK